MRSTTGGQHSFAQIPNVELQRSSFNRSCGVKTTFDAGFLIPIFVDEALPGDTMSLQSSLFARLSTPIHPIMDNLWLDTFYFAVPMRLVWDNWEKFNGEQANPGDSTDFVIPTITQHATLGALPMTTFDHFGIPTGVPGLEHSALFNRAYNLIWNEWFRDENLQDSAVVDTDDGPDDLADYQMTLRRGKRHDYFTSCLPWPQKGPAVELPLGTTAPVIRDPAGDGHPSFDIGGFANLTMFGDTANANIRWHDDSVPSEPNTSFNEAVWNETQLVTDLSNATAATINSIRQAFQIQRLYERDARGGTRYTEIVRAHFGVTSPDQRLQRPEFLGGNSQPIKIQEVPQTSETNNTAQGNLAAYGIVSGSGGGFSKSFVEHTIIIGMCAVRADLNYQKGLERMFSRSTRWDFYWPALANLGEQAVLNKEIFAQGTDDLDADAAVFGYQERFAEYRYKPSQITGLMRSVHAQSLDPWHLAQDFLTLPTLDETFIQEDPPLDRVVSVPSEPHMILDGFFNYRCARPMPVFGVPGQIDHF